MIKIENIEVVGFGPAIRGMRNPMNSWDKSDSYTYIPQFGDESGEYKFCIGENDLKLMKNLVKAGTDHRKFMRMITVYMDITAPLYWWKEFDTYKVGTVANSCSTMHKIADQEFTIDDFSHDHLDCETFPLWVSSDNTTYFCGAYDFCNITCDVLNFYRAKYLETKEKKYWWHIIQLLPSSYNQKRTVMLNYEVLKNIYHARKKHKLDEWVEFCKEIEKLPYSGLMVGGK